MKKTATVHARLDPETKREAEAILRELGMTPTEAVRLLYTQIWKRRGFPLELGLSGKVRGITVAPAGPEAQMEPDIERGKDDESEAQGALESGEDLGHFFFWNQDSDT